MRKEPITPETSDAILDAAWELFTSGRADPGMAEIARAAGVSRQSVYLAFGARAGLLVAMARRADSRSEHSKRMAEIASDPAPTPETLLAFMRAWLLHLPEIFPVGRILVAAATTDADAATVLRDRMDRGLHSKYLAILCPLAAQKRLRKGISAEEAADMIWSLTHLDAWRHLVVERGWTPAQFRESRIEIVRRSLLA